MIQSNENQSIDELLDCLSMEELEVLAGGSSGNTVNIKDSTINIYTTEQKRTTATPYDNTPCPECGQAYCICDEIADTEDTSPHWYSYPIWLMPLIGAYEITKGVWSLGKHLLFTNDDNETIALPQEIDTDIIDTEIVESDNLSDDEIQQQIALYKEATAEEELSEESQHYTNLFRKAIA